MPEDDGCIKDGELRGYYAGPCNRAACQAPNARWFNRSTRAFYCESCAKLINRENPPFQGLPLCYDYDAYPVEENPSDH